MGLLKGISVVNKPRYSKDLIGMLWLTLALLSSLLALSSAQDANCDFSANILPGSVGYVYSPRYPQNYNPGVTCRWIATCPQGYQCRLDCSEVNIPQTTGCSGDGLLVSKSGDPLLTGAEKYCGYGSLSLVSTGSQISIGLVTTTSSHGGRFYCEVRAQLASIPDSNCRCGYKRSNRIVGGEETGINEFPFMALVYDLQFGQLECGGALISMRHIMTAAHCVYGKPVTRFVAVLGEHDISTGGEAPETQVFKISNIIIHPQYSDFTYDYDIAILVLEKNVQFSDRVGPVCLPFKLQNYDFTGDNVTLLGWGTLFPSGPTSNVLQKVNVQVISQSVCRQQVAYLSNRMICNYTPGKDACQYDSGGPMVYTDPQTGLLFSAGIISHGHSCASSKPGVNTRTTEMLNWIVTNTNYNYCMK